MHWNSQKVVESLIGLRAEIQRTTPGGDWDLPGLLVRPSTTAEWVSITPFTDPEEAPPEVADDCNVVAVEVRTNGDCRGGCQTKDEAVGSLYGRIVAILSKAGFNVINHYDEIF